MISGIARRSPFFMSQASLVSRRHLHATPSRLGGYHYPEGPRSNLPFNPMTRFFAARYIAFCGLGFGLPFIIAIWQLKKGQ
ncbi:cytochrome c oxidase subunit VIIc-domain-containing protein [Geopyxis carbonaria]|nr:cytochrome c oxidase subunit VIIc-domain-containing protein [Geopyxis carbonaria]